jgi:opacity protein-like surface antigen
MKMKLTRMAGLLALAGVIAAPMAAHATDGQLGIYVTPKFIYANTKMKDVSWNENYGANIQSIGNQSDDTWGGSLAVGYDFSKKYNLPIRAELEYAAFSKAKANGVPQGWLNTGVSMSHSQRAQTLFLNAYYDIATGTKLTPYVGAGLGAAFIKTKGIELLNGNNNALYDSRTATNFAWNIGVGFGYEITKNVALDVGYRYVDLGKASTKWTNRPGGIDRTQSGGMTQHQIGVGLRIGF